MQMFVHTREILEMEGRAFPIGLLMDRPSSDWLMELKIIKPFDDARIEKDF